MKDASRIKLEEQGSYQEDDSMIKYLLANTVERKTEGIEKRTSKLYKHDMGQQKGLRDNNMAEKNYQFS